MSLNIISLKNNILYDVKRLEIKKKIIDRINELNLTDQKYKNDNEYLLLVCSLIEFLVSKKDNINKIELLIEIYNQLFVLTSDEIETIKNNVKFLHENKQIKKVSFFKLFICGLKELFFKKRKD